MGRYAEVSVPATQRPHQGLVKVRSAAYSSASQIKNTPFFDRYAGPTPRRTRQPAFTEPPSSVSTTLRTVLTDIQSWFVVVLAVPPAWTSLDIQVHR